MLIVIIGLDVLFTIGYIELVTTLQLGNKIL